MRVIKLGGATMSVLLAWSVDATAQDVLLTSRDGTVEIEGTLSGYDRETYRIVSTFGPLTVDATGVVCAGPGCPDLAAYVPEIRIGGDQHLGSMIVPALVETWAWRNGWNAVSYTHLTLPTICSV